MIFNIKIDCKFGSEFQEELFRKLLDMLLGVLKSTAFKHKNNKINIELHEDNN